MSSQIVPLIIIGVSVLFILGIKFLSSPKTARMGNLVAAAGMFVALLALQKKTKFAAEQLAEVLAKLI